MKKWLPRLLILLAGLLLLSVAGTWWIYRDVIRQLNALRSHTVARYYRVNFDKIVPQFFSGSIRIDSFLLYPTDSAMDLLEKGELPYLIRNSFSSLQLKNLAFRKFLNNDELDIGTLVVKNPSISYLFYPDTLRETAGDTTTAARALNTDQLMPLHIGKVQLNNVALTLEDITRREPLLRLDSTALDLTDLSIRDWEAADPLRFRTFNIHLRNFQTTLLPGHILRAGRIDISLQDSILSIMQPSLLPLRSPDNSTPLRLHISMDNILVRGVDMHALLVSQTVKAQMVFLREPVITIALPDTSARRPRHARTGKVSNLRLNLEALEMEHAKLIMRQAGRSGREWLEGSDVNIIMTGFRKEADSLIDCRDLDLKADRIESVFLHHRLELRELHYQLQREQLTVKGLAVKPVADSARSASSAEGGLTLETGPWEVKGFSLEQFLFRRRLNLRHVSAGEGKLLVRLPIGLEEQAAPDTGPRLVKGLIGQLDLHNWTVMLQDHRGAPAFVVHDLTIRSDSIDLPLSLEKPLHAFSRIASLQTGAADIFFPRGQNLSLQQGSWQRGRRLLTAEQLSFGLRRDSAEALLTAHKVTFRGIRLLPVLQKKAWATDTLLIDSAALVIKDEKVVAAGSVFSVVMTSLNRIPVPVKMDHIRVSPLSLQLDQPRKKNNGLAFDKADLRLAGLAYMPADSAWKYNAFTISLPGITLEPFPGYHLTTDSIYMDVGRGKLEVKHPLLLAREDYVHRGISVNMQTDDMLLNGVDVERLLARKELDAGGLEVVSPRIFVTLYPDVLSLSANWQPSLKEGYPFSLQALRVRNAYISFLRPDEQEPLFTLQGAGLQLQHLHTLPPGSSRMMDFASLQLSSDEFSSHTGDGHDLLIRDLQFNSANESVSTGPVSFMPATGKEAFSAKLTTGRDWIKLTSGGIDIRGLNIRRFFSTGILRSRKVVVHEPQIYAYRDKRVPDPTRYQPLPVAILQHASLPLWLDTLQFGNGHITYEVQKPETPDPLRIAFSGLNGRISPVTTLSGKASPVHYMDVKANALLMGKDELRAEIRFHTAEGQHGFIVSGRLDDLPFPSLDTLLGSGSKLRLAGGVLDSLLFRFSGDDTLAQGNLKAHYHHLRLAVLRKKTGKKSAVGSFLLNLLIRSNNAGAQKKLYTADIHFKRDTTKGIFNYWWNALKSGLIDAVLPLKPGRQKHRLKQWLLAPSKKTP